MKRIATREVVHEPIPKLESQLGRDQIHAEQPTNINPAADPSDQPEHGPSMHEAPDLETGSVHELVFSEQLANSVPGPGPSGQPEQRPSKNEVPKSTANLPQDQVVSEQMANAETAADASDESELDFDKIVEKLLLAGLVPFRDQFGQSYASLPSGPTRHLENWPLSLKSRMFRQRFRPLIEAILQGRAKKKDLAETIDRLQVLADNGPEISLANRFAVEPGAVLIDMADDQWRAIRVTGEKWEIVRPQTPVFRRHIHQHQLPAPVEGGDPNEIFDFIPVADEGERLLTLAWFTSAVKADSGTPMCVLLGPPGSLKSTQSKLMRSLIDPSRIGAIGGIERRQLAQVMLHHAVPVFDNLGLFGRVEADFFCGAVTGTGFERRQLFTDSDSFLLQFRRAIILNGLELPSHRADFVDRCLVFHTTRPTEFKPQVEVEQAFNTARPRLLGSILDLLVKTLSLLPTVEPPKEFRMADFGQLGRAVAVALGKAGEDFDTSYRRLRSNEFQETIDDDPLAQAVISLAKTGEFEATTTVLRSKLNGEARRLKLSTKDKRWPKSTRWLSTRLTELDPVFRSAGVTAIRLSKTNTGVRWRVGPISLPGAFLATTETP